MKPKIAYILKMYPRFSETFIVNEILELERRGIDIRIYSLRKPDDGRFHAALARVKANVVYVPQYPHMEPERIKRAHQEVRNAFPERYRQVRRYSEDRGQSYAIKRFLQAGYVAAHLLKHPVDGMHAHFASSATRVANLVKHMIGVPYSVTAHAKDIFHQDVSPNSLRNKIHDARFVVTVSQFNQAYLENVMGDVPSDIRCLYNGIDLTRFRPHPTIKREPNLILGVGRLVEKKGFDTLIRACHILTTWGLDFRCEIIGKGALRDPLKQLIVDLGVQERVRLVGPKPQDGVLAAYRRASIFTLPCVIGSDGNRDGLPTVLLEAMATGLPVVSTNLTGVPEIIDHGQNGLLVPPGNEQALARTLAKLLTNPARRQQMGQAARQKVEHAFDVRQNVAQLDQWLTESLSSSPAIPYPASAEPNIAPLRPLTWPSLPTLTLEDLFATV
ncbi:MAG: glycosyltransferase [Ardenticatenaceae bacterium]